MSMLWRRVDITFLPLLSSSTRVSARDGVDEEEGGGSGPNRFWGEGEEVDVEEGGEEWCSGVVGGLGK